VIGSSLSYVYIVQCWPPFASNLTLTLAIEQEQGTD
jgi:hypothetical protein